MIVYVIYKSNSVCDRFLKLHLIIQKLISYDLCDSLEAVDGSALNETDDVIRAVNLFYDSF